MRKVVIKKLSAMPYAQAHVEIHEQITYLYSYTTLVASVTNDGWVECYGLYSMTTRKHIGAFAKEYCGVLGYSDLKAAYNDQYRINCETGEIEFLKKDMGL